MGYRRWTISVLAGCALLLTRPAEACGFYFHGALMQTDRPGDRSVGFRGRGALQQADTDHIQKRGAASRALQELAPAERFPRIERRDPWEVEDADAERWFGGRTDRREDYGAFVRNPLAREAPDGTPVAARTYRQAVGWMRRHDLRRARAGFEAVLALPSGDARWRSAWAAYMLANLEQDPRRAAERYAEVRALVRGGAHDPMGLAFASLRAEALRRQPWDPAGYVRLCHAYERGGGSLECGLGARGLAGRVRAAAVTDRVLALPAAEMTAAAADPWLATAVTAELAYARGYAYGDGVPAWRAAVEQHGRAAWAGVAAPMAALAHASGDWAGARRWASRGDPADPRIAEVLARLARRRGDDAAVVAALKPLTYLAPEHASWLGEIQLNRGQYASALQTFVQWGDWLGAAYVAERVLTVDELAAEMPRLIALTERAPVAYDWTFCWDITPDTCLAYHQAGLRQNLWALLARRYARLGRWDEAATAFTRSTEQRRVIDRVLAGTSMETSPAYRPTDLGRTAARAARAWNDWRGTSDDATRGVAALDFLDAVIPNRFELLAREGAPDFHAWSGGSEHADGVVAGREDLARWRAQREGARPDEVKRLARSAAEDFPSPWIDVAQLPPSSYTGPGTGLAEDEEADYRERRYHFLWPLAAYAWSAAGLLPDADPAKVQLLCRGGHLLKHRDTWVADRFYKRMVWEGRPDSVAVAADVLRWFPLRDDEGRACTDERSYVDPDPPRMYGAVRWTPRERAPVHSSSDATNEAQEQLDTVVRGIAFFGTSIVLLGVRMMLRALFRRG